MGKILSHLILSSHKLETGQTMLLDCAKLRKVLFLYWPEMLSGSSLHKYQALWRSTSRGDVALNGRQGFKKPDITISEVSFSITEMLFHPLKL